jgi:hypothetical protein
MCIQNLFKPGLWIRIEFSPNPDTDPAFLLNPDQRRIRIHNITLENKFCSSYPYFLKYKLKVKNSSSLYYFVLFRYKMKKVTVPVHFFSIFLPLDPDPVSRFRIQCESGSTTLIETKKRKY